MPTSAERTRRRQEASVSSFSDEASLGLRPRLGVCWAGTEQVGSAGVALMPAQEVWKSHLGILVLELRERRPGAGFSACGAQRKEASHLLERWKALPVCCVERRSAAWTQRGSCGAEQPPLHSGHQHERPLKDEAADVKDQVGMKAAETSLLRGTGLLSWRGAWRMRRACTGCCGSRCTLR